MAAKKKNSELRESLVNRLRKLQQALSSDLDSLKEGGRTVSSDAAADAAQDMAEDELNSQLAEVESREIEAVADAIERIDAGTYGTCDGCDKPIAQARLEALPYAIRCIKCQEEYERDVANNDWPESDDDDE